MAVCGIAVTGVILLGIIGPLCTAFEFELPKVSAAKEEEIWKDILKRQHEAEPFQRGNGSKRFREDEIIGRTYPSSRYTNITTSMNRYDGYGIMFVYLLMDTGLRIHFCGGTVVDHPRLVLTAGHCIDNPKIRWCARTPSLCHIYFAINKGGTTFEQKRRVSKLSSNPRYSWSGANDKSQYDFGVLILKDPAETRSPVVPVSRVKSSVANRRMVEVAGWQKSVYRILPPFYPRFLEGTMQIYGQLVSVPHVHPHSGSSGSPWIFRENIGPNDWCVAGLISDSFSIGPDHWVSESPVLDETVTRFLEGHLRPLRQG